MSINTIPLAIRFFVIGGIFGVIAGFFAGWLAGRRSLGDYVTGTRQERE